MPESEVTMAVTVVDDEARRAYMRLYVETSVTAAWLRACGPEGDPGEWLIGQFMPVCEVGMMEVTVYPYFEHRREDGTISGWSNSRTEHHCWNWRIDVGWDDLTDPEIEAIEDLGGGFDDRECSFFVTGSHKERPPIPDGLIEALVILQKGEH